MKLPELTTILRSKNAGPFRTTFDMFFSNHGAYQRVKNSGVLTKELIAKLYNIRREDVMGPYYVDAAKGIKITIPKLVGEAAGGLNCPDGWGAQQYILLLGIEIP